MSHIAFRDRRAVAYWHDFATSRRGQTRLEGEPMIKTRQTESGVRHEVRYRDPIGSERSRTFTAKRLAEKFEREQRAEVGKGSWLDPRHGSQTFAEFMAKWLAERHDLRPRTLELYRSLLRRHLKPTFGALTMSKLSASSTAVRSCNAGLAHEHSATAAKAYRLLHQLCSTAVADGVPPTYRWTESQSQVADKLSELSREELERFCM